jgi:hypothetical protein
MKVRVTVSFNHDLNDAKEGDHLINLLKDDGRIAAAIQTHGGDAIDFKWERRRDRKVKVDNVVPITVATDAA